MLHTAGKDFAASALGDRSGSRAAVADYLALTASNAAPLAGDTTLAGEIATAGGGLVRKQGTYAHTTGAGTYTLTATFTANATDVVPVTVNKVGVFNAPTGGAMPWSAPLAPAATFGVSGDSLTLTESIAIS